MFEIVVGCLFIVLLLWLSGWFGWQQIQNLRKLDHRGQMSTEDYSYHRRQCYRRLIGCFLTGLLAFMLIGWIFGVGEPVNQLASRVDEARARGAKIQDELQAHERADVLFGWNYVMIMCLVVFAWMGVACMDLMAIRRYGMRHRKRIRDDRMAMLRRQLPQWKRERDRDRGRREQ
jgi:hypothetical protein